MSDEGVGIQSVEDFWGVELSSKKKKVAWPADPNDEVEDDLEKTLELRQACLGAKAKEGERNVVQLTAENEEGQDVTHTILSMRVGGAEQTQLFLTLQPPVTFELVSGNGPVHIIGTLNQTLMPFLSDDESSEEEEEEEEKSKNVLISPEVKGKPALSKKRPAPSPAQKPAKVPKLAAKEEDSEEDSEEEDSEEEDSDDEDEDMETAELAAALREAQAAKNKKQVKGVPREEESDEEEDDESDDEESEEEESEESEEEQPPAKKPQVNGKVKGKPASKMEKGKQLAKTPQPNKPSSKTAVPKGSQSAPTTPKTTGGGDKAKKPTAKVAPNIQEIKQRLLKLSPGIPKKIDKFNNFLGNSFKVTDSAVKKQLWEFVQKNRPEK